MLRPPALRCPIRSTDPFSRLTGLAELHVEPVGPERIGRAVSEHAPRAALRHRGRRMETPAELGWRPIALAVVAARTRRDHVVPGVTATPAARDYVVDGLGRTA